MKLFISLYAIIVLCMFYIPGAEAKRRRLEKDYQKEWCSQHQGQVEVRLPDGTRCDCIATIDGIDYAIEFDFGSKWAEGIGQALYYAVQTGKHAGVVLILEDLKDYKYFIRLNTTIQYHKLNLRTWIIENYSSRSLSLPQGHFYRERPLTPLLFMTKKQLFQFFKQCHSPLPLILLLREPVILLPTFLSGFRLLSHSRPWSQ